MPVEAPRSTHLPLPEAGAAEAAAGPPRTTRRYIRGSGLLAGGRLISLGLNLATQVLIVRYLSKGDYGAFAYALSVASFGTSAVLLGLDKAVPRFIPIYREHGEPGRMLGSVVAAAAAVLGLGLSLVLAVIGFRGALGSVAIHSPLALGLLLVLIGLAPVEAFDTLMQAVTASFLGPRSIFFRRHVLAPGLRLLVVVLVLAFHSDVRHLAYGYLVSGVLGASVYVTILLKAWRAQGLLHHLRPRNLDLPVRELFGYSLPLVSSDFIVILRDLLPILLLGAYGTTTGVAEYRAVAPIAKLNLVVLQSFSYLFIPVASGLFARREDRQLDALYWQTAGWISVLSFPVVAVTFSLAGPLSVLLFGARYASSAPVLAVMAAGYYVHAALGFNSFVLRVYGRIRYVVAIDVFTGCTSFALYTWLIPSYGALGAAIGTTATILTHNGLNQAALILGRTGVRSMDRAYVRVFAIAIALNAGLLLVQILLRPPLYATVGAAATASLLILRLSRGTLRLETTFPELLRIPLLRRLLA